MEVDVPTCTIDLQSPVRVVHLDAARNVADGASAIDVMDGEVAANVCHLEPAVDHVDACVTADLCDRGGSVREAQSQRATSRSEDLDVDFEMAATPKDLAKGAEQ